MSTVDYQKILQDMKDKKLIGKSQNFIAKELGVSRHAVRKALVNYSLTDDATDEEIPVGDDNVVTMTDNGCVSLTPTSAAPAANGDVFRNKKTGERLIIVLVDHIKKLISYMPTTVLSLKDEAVAEGEDTAFDYSKLVKISTINFKSFKRKGLEHKESDHRFIHTQASAAASGFFDGTVETSVGNSTELWYDKFRDEFNSDVTLIKSSKPDSSYDVSGEEVEETSVDNCANEKAIKKLKSEGCPFKLTVSTRAVNVIADGNNYSITSDEKQKFELALEAVEKADWERLLELCKMRHQKAVDISATLSNFGFTVKNGYVIMGDKTGEFKLGGVDVLMRRIESFALAGDENGVTAMAKFLDKLLENPDQEIMNRIIDFIRFGDVEVDEEGYLIAYKYVDSNFKDSFTNRLDNRPGSVVRMKRALVDKDIKNECSQGLHVCALSYVFGFWGHGKRLVKVRLNPRDIVAIPKDYKGAKIRCSEYTVMSDVTDKFLKRQIPVDFKGIFKGI